MLRVIVVAAALAVAGQAVAQDELPTASRAANGRAFELFDRYCLQTDGAILPAAALADADGWAKAPPEFAADLGLVEPFQIRESAPLAPGGDPATLVVSSTTIDGLEFRMCLVLTGAVLDKEILTPMFVQRLGVKGRALLENQVWAYSGDGPYVDEGDLFGTPAIQDAAHERTMRGITAGEFLGMPSLSFVRMGK